jgi:NAD(P)H-nitrite reductase large subunit
MTKYLIIGNGVAGTTAAQEIRKNDSQGSITMVTEETTPYYSRIKLPDYIAGIADKSDLILKKEQWYKDNNIDLKTGVLITGVDHLKKQAKDQAANIFEYDSLLIATGSNPFVPPIEGSKMVNVFTLKSEKDAGDIVKASDNAINVAAIGGGLLGIEAAHALVKRGLNLTIIEFFDRLLPRQMDSEGAQLLKKMLEDQGFQFRLAAKTKQIQGDNAVTGVELDSGEVIPAEMVLLSAGVRANLVLPQQLNLNTDMGVVVDEHMETSINGIYAAGDIAQFEKTNFCIWPEAQEQGRIAGVNMAGGKDSFKPIVPSNRLKVAGIDLGSAGDIDPDGVHEIEIEKSDTVYRKLVKKDGKLVGCIMLGDISGFSDAVKQIGAN